MGSLEGNSVLIVVSSQGFQDEEYTAARSALEAEGVKVAVSCKKAGPATGLKGLEVPVDVLLGDVSVNDYDALLFVGGTETKEYREDPLVDDLSMSLFMRGTHAVAIQMFQPWAPEGGPELSTAMIATRKKPTGPPPGPKYPGGFFQDWHSPIPDTPQALGAALVTALKGEWR